MLDFLRQLSVLQPLQESINFTEGYVKPVGGPMYHNLTGYDMTKRYADTFGPVMAGIMALPGLGVGMVHDLLQKQNPFPQAMDRFRGMADYFNTRLTGRPTPTSMAYSPYQAEYIPPVATYRNAPNSSSGNSGGIDNFQRARDNRPQLKQINSQAYKGMGYTRGR